VTASIRDTILTAKRKLEDLDLTPKWIYMSPSAHESFLNEVNQIDNRKHEAVLEIAGMVIKIDPDCPPWGAYIKGEDKKDGKKFQDEKTLKINKAGGKEHG
jgi:hypothetical protein